MLEVFEMSPALYGLALIPPFFFVLQRIKMQNDFTRKSIYFIFFLIISINIFLTFSRGTVLAIILSIIFFQFLKFRFRLLPKFFLGTILIFVLFSNYFDEGYKYYSILKGSNPDSEVVIYSNRDYLASQSIKLFLNNPIIGVGQGHISDFLGKHAHNTYLEMLAENGIFSFLIFLMIILLVFFKGFYVLRNINLTKSEKDIFEPIYLSFITLCVALIPSSAISSSIFWIVMGISFQISSLIFRARFRDAKSI